MNIANKGIYILPVASSFGLKPFKSSELLKPELTSLNRMCWESGNVDRSLDMNSCIKNLLIFNKINLISKTLLLNISP